MIDQTTLFNISYGLFVLTAREGNKDNGCIINTAQQLTSEPLTISISVNKENFTHAMIKRTREFNISILTEDAPFEIFKHYGFQSGRDTNKILGDSMPRGKNGIVYLSDFANAFISGKVINEIDCGTHTLFIAQVTEADKLSEKKSVTYQYYFDNIKPKTQPQRKKGYVCEVCGYVYEGDELPDNFVCPVCKHGSDVFRALN